MPHYRQMSALYIKPPSPKEKEKNETKASVFPKILFPELNLANLFLPHTDMDKCCLSLNLMSRQMHLNLNKLRADYMRMRTLENEIELLEAEKKTYTAQIAELIKQSDKKKKKDILESSAVKKLIQAGNEIKSREAKIAEDLIPLAEIVNVASLRLPNSLHASTLFLDTISENVASEECFRHVLFDMSTSALQPLKAKMRRDFDHGFDWRALLDDAVIVDGQRVPAKYSRQTAKATVDNSTWSMVKESSIESIQNNRYLVGTYAKLEQAIVDYVNAKIGRLNDSSENMPNFEHIKSVSMFKSALVEGNLCFSSKITNKAV